MKLMIHTTKILTVHVCVDLRCGDVGMAQHFLDGAQVGTTFKKMGGEGMSECVW